MFPRSLVLAFAIAGGLFVSSQARAESFDPRSVEARQEQIRRNVESGAAGFSEIPTEKKKELRERQDTLLGLIDGRSYEQLDEAQRAEAVAQIEWIDRAAREAADERIVCERTRASGTNRVTRVCMSVRRQREAQEAARKSMQGPRISPQYDLR